MLERNRRWLILSGTHYLQYPITQLMKTDQSDGIDPETDSDGLAVNVPSRPWVTRLPTYRAAIVSKALEQLDVLEINQSKDESSPVSVNPTRGVLVNGKRSLEELKEMDPADIEDSDESMGVEHWLQSDDEDGVIDPQLRSDLDGGSLKGSDDDDL
ncbi:hypothetical protein PILCRDRAFT_6939 [Piloderma croceum F 1598]|uniref:Uncharacterized protein n=1 Tax=Piloderma croceum (strain F 1598) TaxID=765440 RepID=A0A0C3FYY7_PILCF|nr:hypothetical protein PILCRDRAFT_6939 [Piloderma croceum F 1598]